MIRCLGWRLDGWLTGPVVVLLVLGVLMARVGTGQGGRQAIFAIASLVALLTAARIDYRFLRTQPIPSAGYVLTILVLATVLLAGSTKFGAQRWLEIGGNSVQPSEFAKVVLVGTLAALASTRPPLGRALIESIVLITIPLVLVALQPNAGTALVLLTAWLAVVLTWGMPWRFLTYIAVCILAATPLLFALAVPSYQLERIATFVDPGRDPLGSGFTLRQVELALGSGGLTGRGLLPPTESALAFVPARTSDFVFALVGEQLGLLGAIGLLILLAVISWRGLIAAAHAPDRLGRVLAAGLTAVLFTQASVHVAVNLRLLPTTGIPFPFVSQGGSALIAMGIAAGLIASVAARRPPTAREQWSAQRWHA